MRGLPARRVASSVLCATVLIGIAGPAAVAADNDSARKHVHAASSAPVPNADTLLAPVKKLGDLGTVLGPVTDLLTQALKADNGQLSADQAKSLGDAVTAAVAKITAAAPAAPAVPATPAVPAAPAVPAVPALPSLKSADDAKAKAPADLAGDALASLQKAVATLLAAVTSGNVAGVVPAVTGVVTGLVNVVAATLLGGGLPAPSLPGLPALPSLPSTSSLPAVPAVPAVPGV